MLKLQNFGHLMRRDDSLQKSLMLGKIEDRRWRVNQRTRWLDGIMDAIGKILRDGEGQGGLVCCSSWGHKESDTTGQLDNNKGGNVHGSRQKQTQIFSTLKL